MKTGEGLLTEREAARYLGLSRSFLAQSRMDGNREGHTPGPPYVRLGRAIRYALQDLDRWIAIHREVPTSSGQSDNAIGVPHYDASEGGMANDFDNHGSEVAS